MVKTKQLLVGLQTDLPSSESRSLFLSWNAEAQRRPAGSAGERAGSCPGPSSQAHRLCPQTELQAGTWTPGHTYKEDVRILGIQAFYDLDRLL